MIVINGTEYEGVAISYQRVSSGKQTKGRGLGRQDDGVEKWCREHNRYLDTSFTDAGMPAYRKQNATKGALFRLVQLAESGTWKVGTVLVIDHIDRLSRAEIDDAQILFRRILDTGLEIVTLLDGQHWTLDSWKHDLGKRVIALIMMAVANEESRKKEMRLLDVWAHRRDAMRAGNGKATNASCEWLTARDGAWQNTYLRDDELWAGPGEDVRMQQRFRAIEMVRELRYQRRGKHYIATALNEAGIASMRGKTWYGSAVERLVKSKALIGIYQPCDREGNEVGEPIPNHYPRVMTDDDWFRMQWPRNERASAGRKPKGVNNLLQGIVKCGCPACGGMAYIDKGKGNRYLACERSRYKSGCANRYHHPYPSLEAGLLDLLAMFDYGRLVQSGSPKTDKLAGLRAELESIAATVDRLLDDFSASVPASVTERIKRLEARRTEAQLELDDGERASRLADANTSADTFAAFRKLIADATTATGDELTAIRTRLYNEVCRIIATGEANDHDMSLWIRTVDYPNATADYPMIEIRAHRGVMKELVIHSHSGARFWFPVADLIANRIDFEALVSGYREAVAA